jgi:hypothetical protein
MSARAFIIIDAPDGATYLLAGDTAGAIDAVNHIVARS